MSRYVLAGIMVAGLGISAVHADISGRVVDEQGTGIAGADVTVRALGISTTSGSDGSFIIASSRTMQRSLAGSTDWVRLSAGGVLEVNTIERTATVRVEVFGLDGRCEAMMVDAAGTGARQLHIGSMLNALRGARLLRVSAGTRSEIIALGPFGAARERSAATQPTVLGASFAQLAVVDTIRVLKHGYAAQRMCIGTLDTAVGDIVLHDIDSRMVLVPAADSGFMMGQPRASMGGYNTSTEQPVHHVAFTYDYYLDSTEVTQGEYETVMGEDGPWDLVSNTFKAAGIGDSLPAHSLTWYNAVLYCNARSKRDGLDTVYDYAAVTEIGSSNNYTLTSVVDHVERNGYRLPSEAEWEYAYTTDDTFDFFWGVDWSEDYPADAADSAQVDSFAVYRGNSYGMGATSPLYGTHPVAGKRPNRNGLYDMSGNVAEWIHDGYAAYTADSLVDPIGTFNSTNRVVRGGGWEDESRHIRGHRRMSLAPQSYNREYGFRVALPLR
jgi:formylglycine-generating enzyme required for sulfatase activity